VSAPDTGEVLTNAHDRNAGGLPREGAQRKSGAGPGAPTLWGLRDVEGFAPEPVWGTYPKGFIAWATRLLDVDPREVLHLCSGAIPHGHGLRVDLRAAARPDVRADARRLPFRDAIFAAVMIDPPYTVEYARDLYGIEYPRPSHLLAEASRVVRPCGRVAILHFLVPMGKAPLRLETVHGITTGAGYRIRAFSVYRREQESML
jgi:SAM-dependent methyltransferase